VIQILIDHLRALIQDKKALETLEYAVFAAAFLIMVTGAVALLAPSMSSAYADIGTYIVNLATNM
jgi:hypothetical protein